MHLLCVTALISFLLVNRTHCSISQRSSWKLARLCLCPGCVVLSRGGWGPRACRTGKVQCVMECEIRVDTGAQGSSLRSTSALPKTTPSSSFRLIFSSKWLLVSEVIPPKGGLIFFYSDFEIYLENFSNLVFWLETVLKRCPQSGQSGWKDDSVVKIKGLGLQVWPPWVHSQSPHKDGWRQQNPKML